MLVEGVDLLETVMRSSTLTIVVLRTILNPWTDVEATHGARVVLVLVVWVAHALPSALYHASVVCTVVLHHLAHVDLVASNDVVVLQYF